MARTCLLANGRPRYRFIGLFDNDDAGRRAVKFMRLIDSSALEFKDVFRLWPVMSLPGNLDPGTVQKTFERENADFKGLDWELEDLLSSGFKDTFVHDFPTAVAKTSSKGGKIHHDLTRDGKANFHRYVKQNAVADDMKGVIETLKAIRWYLNFPK